MITRMEAERLQPGDIMIVTEADQHPRRLAVLESYYQPLDLITVFVKNPTMMQKLFFKGRRHISRENVDRILCNINILCDKCLLRMTCNKFDHAIDCYQEKLENNIF